MINCLCSASPLCSASSWSLFHFKQECANLQTCSAGLRNYRSAILAVMWPLRFTVKSILLKSLYQVRRLTYYSAWLKRFFLFWNIFNGPIWFCPLETQESSFRLGSNFFLTFLLSLRTILPQESPITPFFSFQWLCWVLAWFLLPIWHFLLV